MSIRQVNQSVLLVTGHLGFVGSAFCRRMRERYSLVGIDHLGWGAMIENLAPGVLDVRADIVDSKQVSFILDKYQPFAIINFAAESHVDRSIESDLSFWHSNVFGARLLALEASKRKIRMVQVSTDEVYGDATELSSPWTETTPLQPKNPYSVTKAAAEMMLKSYHKTLDLDVVMTRGANTVGPCQFPEKAIPKAISFFLSGKAFPLFRTPARRMWLHVDDHARGVELALEHGKSGETYNLAPAASSEAFTQDVIEQVRKRVGKGKIEKVEDRKAYDLRYWMSSTQAERHLGWQAQHDLEETINTTVDWYLKNQTWLTAANTKLQGV
jgi:dTDP-glucose 4,6-dehydratase